jgi:hypothetical protein
MRGRCWGWAGNAEKFKSKGSFDKKEPAREGSTHIGAQTFTFRELAAATKNFRPECLLGEGGFGRVYKGRLENTGQASGIGSVSGIGVCWPAWAVDDDGDCGGGASGWRGRAVGAG